MFYKYVAIQKIPLQGTGYFTYLKRLSAYFKKLKVKRSWKKVEKMQHFKSFSPQQ